MKGLKQFSFVIFIITILFFVHITQRLYDDNNPPKTIAEDLKYLPNGKFLKGIALSYDEVLADLLWIKTIGYFADQYRTTKDYRWFSHLLDITTTLDPCFQIPYEFGGIILAYELDDTKASMDILKKGMKNVPKHHPRYWYLPFFTAFNYMYYYGDYEKAARYLEIASSFPQRPDYLPLLVSRLYANTDDPGIAIPFLENMKQKAVSEEMRNQLEKRIKEIKVKQHVLVLGKYQELFKEKTGRYPDSLDELVSYGLLKNIPKEPFGGYYYIDKADNSVKSSSNVDDLKVHINKNKKESPTIIIEEKQ